MRNLQVGQSTSRPRRRGRALRAHLETQGLDLSPWPLAAFQAVRRVFIVSDYKWSIAHHPRCRVFKSIEQAVAAICAIQARERARPKTWKNLESLSIGWRGRVGWWQFSPHQGPFYCLDQKGN
jgi:hypothetical protein